MPRPSKAWLAQHHHSPLATKGLGHDFHHPTIERREKPIVRNRHGDEVCIGDLSVPYESIGGNARVVRHRDSIIPKAVTGGRGEIAKENNGLGGGPRVWNGPTVRRNSDESRLGGRCGGPAFAMGSQEPRARGLMVDVIGPRDRDENVDIEQRDHC